MKKINKLLILFFLVLSACNTIVHRDDIAAMNSKKSEEQALVDVKSSIDEPEKTPSFKKVISDVDHKKNEEDMELKKRVVVLPFIDKSMTRSLKVLTQARDTLLDALNETQEMIAVDPSVLKLDLKKYIKNNMYDLPAIAKDARTAGISSILEGRIIELRFKNEDALKVDNASSLRTREIEFEVVVQARLYNIRSNQELLNTVKTVTISDENVKIAENISSEVFFQRNEELTKILIKDAFMDFTPKLTDALKSVAWEGRIAALQGDRIYLNVGQISGVQVGDILKVVDDGNEIYDTELGYHVGKVRGRVKGTLEIVSFFGQDGSVSVIHSGAGFKENDRVELYQ